MQLLFSLQKFVITYKKQIIWVFLFAELSAVLLWIWGAYSYSQDPASYMWMYGWGGRFGQIAFLLYVTTLIPGIMKRFQLLPLLQATIMPIRRHIGILMFLMAIVHMGYMYTIPTLFTQPIKIEALSTHATYGLIAVLLLFPMWLTSNDFSQKKLGRKWFLLHKLTYLACFMIFMHVSLVNQTLTIIGGIFLLLEIASWIKAIFFNKKAMPTQPQIITSTVSQTVAGTPSISSTELQKN